MTKGFLKLAFALALVLAFHQLYFYQSGIAASSNLIFLAYGLNFVAVVLLILVLQQIKTLLKQSLGFAFLFGSFLKIILYFLFFQPAYSADGTVTKLEFFSFFVPYLVCLVGETLLFKRMADEA